MARRIKIKTQNVQMEAELNDSKAATLIWENLPIACRLNTWGEEIYFSIPIKVGLENPKEVVEAGDLGYWPQGPAFCIFFGPTPISRKAEIRPASPVNLVGRLCGRPEEFRKVKDGEDIQLVRI